MPESTGPGTLIRCLHELLPVPLPAHLPATASNSRGSCDANSVVPVSSHNVTPGFSVSPAETNAVLSPSVARRTDWPTGQALIAAWIGAVSSVSSLGTPFVTVFVATTVAQAVGMVGSAPMASQAGGAIGDSVPPVPVALDPAAPAIPAVLRSCRRSCGPATSRRRARAGRLPRRWLRRYRPFPPPRCAALPAAPLAGLSNGCGP